MIRSDNDKILVTLRAMTTFLFVALSYHAPTPMNPFVLFLLVASFYGYLFTVDAL